VGLAVKSGSRRGCVKNENRLHPNPDFPSLSLLPSVQIIRVFVFFSDLSVPFATFCLKFRVYVFSCKDGPLVGDVLKMRIACTPIRIFLRYLCYLLFKLSVILCFFLISPFPSLPSV
jgi:hypothetical protein